MAKKNTKEAKPLKLESNPITEPPKKIVDNNLPFVDYFENLGSKCQWIALALLVIMGMIVFRNFLFFDRIFLHKDIGSDSLNGYYAIIEHSIRYIQSYGFPSWSFEFGMGQNAFAYTLFDPFDFLLYPLGIEKMRSLLGFKIMVQLIIAGFVFYHYLRAIQMKQLTSIIGSLIYAFSGFAIVSSCWFGFTIEVFTMPLILLGIEKLYKNNQYWLLPIPIILLVMAKPFTLATLTIFLFVYISFRLLQENQFNIKNYGLILGKMALAGLVAVIITAPWLLEHLQLMLESPRGSGANSLSSMLKASPLFATADSKQLGTSITRTFASDILGSGNEFKGWMNILEAPAFYCGIVCLLLIPQLFVGTPKRLKIIYASFLGIWIIPVIFPYFRYAFSFFTGDYYRSFSFYVGLALSLMALLSLDKILETKKVNLIVLGSTLLLLFILLYYPYFEAEDIRESGITSFVSLALILYAALIFYLPKSNPVIQYALLGLLALELTYLSSISINQRDQVTKDDLAQKIGYNDYTIEALNFLKKQDPGFYRIDKRYYSSPAMHGSLNDGMVQGYFGTTMYNSFNQKYYIQYLKATGIIQPNAKEEETRWASGLTGRMVLEGLNSVKYVLTKSPLDPGTMMAFDSIARFGDVKVLRHKFSLPFGYAYQAAFSLKDFEKCSLTQRDFMSLQAAIVADSNMNEIKSIPRLSLNDTIAPQAFSFEMVKSRIDSLSLQSFQLKEFKPTHIKGSISMNAPGIVYFSIPYDANWTVKDDQNKIFTKFLLSDGMIGIYLDKGVHNLDLSFASKNLALGKKISLAGILLMGLLIFVSIKFRKDSASSV